MVVQLAVFSYTSTEKTTGTNAIAEHILWITQKHQLLCKFYGNRKNTIFRGTTKELKQKETTNMSVASNGINNCVKQKGNEKTEICQ